MKTLFFALVCSGAAFLARGETAPAADQPPAFTVPLDRLQMIGVTYATVETKPLQRILRAVGLVAPTTAGQWDYVARVDGYVHRLGVSAPGERVERGQVLLDLYSPDLVSTENEYLDLLRMRDAARREQNGAAAGDAERMLEGARARLEQWNISSAQIDAVAKAGRADPYLRLESPVKGLVAEVAVRQGARVVAGDLLLRIVDLSSVWIWAELYEDELPLVRPGLAVTITSSAVPGLSVAGKIAVVDPFIDEAKRTGRVRIDVDNPGQRLRPGAYVDVALALDAGTGLTIPVGAVLPTGEHNVVFVDRGSGKLEPRFVGLGGKFGDDYRVTSGLRAGERVVSSANFLIDAESKVQGALKSW